MTSPGVGRGKRVLRSAAVLLWICASRNASLFPPLSPRPRASDGCSRESGNRRKRRCGGSSWSGTKNKARSWKTSYIGTLTDATVTHLVFVATHLLLSLRRRVAFVIFPNFYKLEILHKCATFDTRWLCRHIKPQQHQTHTHTHCNGRSIGGVG